MSLALAALAPCCLSADDGPARLVAGINHATLLLVLVPFAIVAAGLVWLAIRSRALAMEEDVAGCSLGRGAESGIVCEGTGATAA